MTWDLEPQAASGIGHDGGSVDERAVLDSPDASAEKDTNKDGRKVSGSPVFIAASVIDQSRTDVTFEQALALARLVLIHGGGPAALRGKGAVITCAVAKQLKKLGLVEQIQAGSVDAVYQTQSTSTLGTWTPRVAVVGARDNAKWYVLATDEGRNLVHSAMGDPT